MRYTENGKEYDSDSAINQKIKKEFVNREIMCCMTSEVEYILRTADFNDDAPFCNDDFENEFEYECEKCGTSGDYDYIYPSDEEVEISHDDDGYYCPVCGICYGSEAEARECCEDTLLYKCNYCGAIYTEEKYEQLNVWSKEIFEWWAVTDWLGEKLKNNGEAVIETWGKSYWGRQSTGQAIALDYIMSKICHDMEILEGQKYSWEGKI